jgi:replicative DNA helicase Mcm
MIKKGLVKREKIGGIFRYSLSERGKEILSKIDLIQKIFSSDIAFVKVKKIEEASPTNEYVYDLSTPGHENFVAGFGGVICHNSRFDLKFALRDLPNPELDSKIADHILRMRQYEEEAKPLFEPGFIRKWIAYARARVHPTLTPEAGNRLKEFYLDMRLKAGEEAPVAITLRQYEALLRLAEASARVRLSDKIELEDAERAIRLMKVSLRQFGFEPETGAIDIDRAEGARVTSAQRSKIRIMLDVIEELGKTFGKEIPTDEIIRRAKEQNVDDAEEILRKMQYEGIVYSPRTGFISKV